MRVSACRRCPSHVRCSRLFRTLEEYNSKIIRALGLMSKYLKRYYLLKGHLHGKSKTK